eukprot:5740347-Alexandrium_andersonii.AAC.1
MQSLDALFELTPPAAKVANGWKQHGVRKAGHGTLIPQRQFKVCHRTGTAGRINAGVCVLQPDKELLD